MSRGTKASLHEDYGREHEVKGGTDRGFGLTVGGILLLIAVVRSWLGGTVGWLETALALIGVVLVALGLIAPARLAGANRAWTKLGLVLFKVVNPIVLGAIYLTTIVPIGLILRALGKDPLHLRFDPAAPSYWIEREPPGPAPETMTQQF